MTNPTNRKAHTMNTFTTVLARSGITVPDQALADIEVPILTGPQRQGDVGIWPTTHASKIQIARMTPVPPEGIAIVRGETTGGNAHILHADGPVAGQQSTNGDLIAIGTLHVPDGATAFLIHSDEHGVNAMGPGTYRVTGKREQAAEQMRVAD